ncbi:MAG: phosphotransferase [Verrucomicrobiota bacterium]
MPATLDPDFKAAVLNATGADHLRIESRLQDLWSGYGQILRIGLDGGADPSVIAKHVRPPTQAVHPRGWHTSASHQRKARSYEVEAQFYRSWSERCRNGCRVPHFLAYEKRDEEILLVLEDLDAAGFPLRKQRVTPAQLDACLGWLASLHATFMGETPDGLWEIGTYWHLDTRSDELAALDDLPLKQAAPTIDRLLNEARFKTLVHGDAKLANFCFSEDDRVAAVDFQYVGGGCGVKDLAYFIGSCLDENECEAQEAALLDAYFLHLRRSLSEQGSTFDAKDIETEWRRLFPIAWTDFHRFLKGWSPGHWKINSYSERLARKVIASL